MNRKTQAEKNRAEQARINRMYFDTFHPEGMLAKAEIMEDLARHFEPRSMVKRTPDGLVDVNATLVNNGAYEVLSFIRQRIEMGAKGK